MGKIHGTITLEILFEWKINILKQLILMIKLQAYLLQILKEFEAEENKFFLKNLGK